jgi:hypothetical protein
MEAMSHGCLAVGEAEGRGKVGLECIREREIGGESSCGSICDCSGLWLKAYLVCCRVFEERD